MKANKENRRAPPFILNLGTRNTGSLYVPTVFPPGKNPGIHQIGGFLGFRACLDVLEKRKIRCFYQDSKSGPVKPVT
jgi:hypothetical protein